MRILFMGSARFACPAIERLHASGRHRLVAVVTQPDRPQGRRLKPAPCPVKAWAVQHGLDVLSPEKIGAPDAVQAIKERQPDLIVVAAYGQYIPSSVLNIPKHRAINIHPSLLPKYRGAAPIQWAVANGDAMTGVTILYVSEKLDAGDMLMQQEHPIRDEDTAATLEPRLAEAGAELLLRTIDLIEIGHAHPVPQREEDATLAPKLEKEDGRINWSQPAATIRNRVRGFQPWPGSFFHLAGDEGRMVKVIEAKVEAGVGRPGAVLSCDGGGPLVAAGLDAVRLVRVQPTGKREMDGAAFLCGYRLKPGDQIS